METGRLSAVRMLQRRHRFGLLLAQMAGCNRLIVNSDNMKVIDTMKNGGHSAGAAAAILRIVFYSL